MKDEDIIAAALDNMSDAISADRENREESLDDLRKAVGFQWPEDIRAEREAEGKPCLTVNRLPQFVRQVTGDIRRMNPSVKVIAADNEATKETAEIYEGLIRHIEYRSDAASIYEQTAESAAACSIGWFRVMNEWEDDESFNQEIRIKRIRNVFSVYCDPSAEMPTREDADYIFITESIKTEDFKEMYPDAKEFDFEHDGVTDGLLNWHSEGNIIVAEYYWKEPVEREIAMLSSGEIVENPVAPMDIVRKRKVMTHKVMWAKITGKEVLEGPISVPSKSIPVIAITGEEWDLGDRVHRSSVIRYAKDPQQMYNYWRSASTELVALQPKAPYMVTTKQISGLESFWNDANNSNRPYLPYNPDEKAGPPARSTPPVSSAGMIQEIMSAAEDMKATTGIYDAGLGERSNEVSGVAIRQRQLESDVSTSIYTDNMAKAIAQCGRIMIEMIPKIYDTQRIIRIIGPDDAEKMIQVNGSQQTIDGHVPINDLSVGKYDIRVNVGPNYSTRRQETADGMLEFIRVFPAAAQVTGDLVAKSMDWPDADKFSDRLKKLLPPGIIDPSEMEPEEQQRIEMERQAQQQAQQQAQLVQGQMQQIEMRKSLAESAEAESDAEKSRLEVAEKYLELAVANGQLDAVIRNEVARALQGALSQGPAPL